MRTKEKVGKQHQGMDRPGVRQVQEGSGEQGTMEKTGCKIICGAPTTLAVKGLMMIMIMMTSAPPPLQIAVLCLLLCARLSPLECRFPPLCSPAARDMHVQSDNSRHIQPNADSIGLRREPSVLQYSRDQLFTVSPSGLKADPRGESVKIKYT